MSSSRYWVWLQQALGEGAGFKDIIDDFGSAENLYNANIIEWKQSTALSKSQIERLQKYQIEDADKIVEVCENNNWDIICYDDEKYPNRLRDIPNPPAVLYVDGKLMSVDDNVLISIVGTRKASTYALKAAYIMAKGISRCGAIVVSGGALGVDTASHKGAISENAKTIAVLGCGLGSNYLQANKELREEIKNFGGALVTEYPPFTAPTRRNFPLRNRIISGLSLGTLVVEAGVKSGSLITAKYANEQGRDVFVIPASIFDERFQGTNRLLLDGAIVAISPDILIKQYAEQFSTLDLSKAKTAYELSQELKPKSSNAPEQRQVSFDNVVEDREEAVKRQDTAVQLTGNEKVVYSVLSQDLMSVDEIISITELDAKTVLTALTMLEIKKLVESASGKRYRLK